MIYPKEVVEKINRGSKNLNYDLARLDVYNYIPYIRWGLLDRIANNFKLYRDKELLPNQEENGWVRVYNVQHGYGHIHLGKTLNSQFDYEKKDYALIQPYTWYGIHSKKTALAFGDAKNVIKPIITFNHNWSLVKTARDTSHFICKNCEMKGYINNSGHFKEKWVTPEHPLDCEDFKIYEIAT